MIPRRSVLTAAAALGGLAMAGQTSAQPWPGRLVTLVATAPAGSTPDLLARILADKLRGLMAQEVIVDNRPGVGGAIAGEFVARAAPDGHVLLCATEWLFFSHLMNPRPGFDPRTLEPVSLLVRYPLLMIARPDLPVGSIADLIAYARLHPGKLNYASSGKASMHQLVYEAIKSRTGVDLVHVPYRGGPPAMADLLAGRVDVSLTSINQAIAHIRSGRLKLLGIAGGARLPEFPDAPALSEVVSGLEPDAWTGVAAPPRTPRDVTVRVAQAIARAFALPDVRERLSELKFEPVASTPDQMAEAIQRDEQRWLPVIRAAGIRAE